MAFASIHVPEFSVQAVIRAEPPLRGRAVALIEGKPPVYSVVAANEPARRAGIALGMTKSQAADFSGVEIRQRSSTQENTAHAALLDLGWSISPHIEDTAPHTILLDLAGLASLHGSDETIAHRLVREAAKLGLDVNVAIASNAEAALFAARGFSGVRVIPPGEEQEQLGFLPVGALSPSAEILETLERWGVHTCRALAALPVVELSERLGQEGVRLRELARGSNSRSLILAGASRSFVEEMELEDAVEELEPLAFLLARLLDQLCARLEARSLAAAAIHTRFELEPSFEKDFLRANDSRRKPPAKTYEKILALPVPMRDPKTLLKLLRLQLQNGPPAAPILKITLEAEAARPPFAQGGLFLPSSPDPEKLELTIARLASLVGEANVGSPDKVDTHRPGEFRMSRFCSPCEIPEAGPQNGDEQIGAQPAREATARRPAASFRVFRPSVPASVELRDGRPARVRFPGLYGDVVAASGPWRTSGDWWREDGWHNDEWDIEILSHANSPAARHSQHGLYRIFFDSIRKGWFVRGMYD
jgi:protein ImuB